MEANVDILGIQNDQDTASLRLGFPKPQVSSKVNRGDQRFVVVCGGKRETVIA